MEQFCYKCDTAHIRPVGRRCYRTGMATNITSDQATVAASALISQQSVGGLPSPIQAGPSGSSLNSNTSNTMITTSNSQTQHTNLRTDELILAELQKLSARMTQVEQELHTDTFASTPRRRKRTGPNRQASDSSMFGAINRTGAYTSVDESAVQPRNPEVRIPVHVHSNSTTITTTSSLFAQAHQVSAQQGNVATNTQTVFSTCRTSNHTHQVQTAPNAVTFTTTQRGPVLSTAIQGTGPWLGPVPTTNLQVVSSIPHQATVVGTSQQSQVAQNGLQQHHIQATHMQGSHLPGQVPPGVGQVPLLPTGITQAPLLNTHMAHATVPQTSNQAVTRDHTIIPSIQALRTTAVNQDLVQQRLQELNHLALPQQQGNYIHYNPPQVTQTHVATKPKGKKEKVEVVWPQDCAFVGHLRARVSYEQLTQAQFVLGFLRSFLEEQDGVIKGNMVEYLTELFQNVCDHSWQAAKGAHLVVMTKMEEGLIAWNDLKKVNKVRKTYVRATSNPSSSQPDNTNSSNKKGPRKSSSIPCKDYNEGRCSKTADHDQGLITHKHVCAYCMYTYSRLYNHPEAQCNNKRRKNSNGMPQQ